MTNRPREKASASPRSLGGLSHEAVRDELGRVLASPEFLASEKRRRFLSFVVGETLAGRADRLKGYTIATEVFERDSDFDSAHDPIVRIQAGKLRRELERYYLVAGRRDPVRIDMPKGRYVPLFIQQQPRPRSDSPAAVSEASGVLVTPSIAVLPLANLTADSREAYFVDGLLAEFTRELGRYQDIIAISCTGGTPPSDTPLDVKRTAANLGVRFLLGGALRKDANTGKIIVHLTDAATGRQVWSDAYKYGLGATDIISTQEAIARDVVGTIAGELGIISQRLSRESRSKPPAELTTYEALLRYHHYMQAMTVESYQEAFVTLQAAVKRESEYGPIWAALANLYNHAYIWDVPGVDRPLETATEYARKSVVLEPRSQLVHAIMAYVHLLRGERESVLDECDLALSLNPNSPYFSGTIGYVLVMSGEFDRGRALVDRAIALNPCHPRWFHHACWLDDYRRGDYEASYRQASMAGPMLGFWQPVLCAASLGELGRGSEAKAFVDELRQLKPDFEARARELIERVSRIDDLVERIIVAMRRAGLRIR